MALSEAEQLSIDRGDLLEVEDKEAPAPELSDEEKEALADLDKTKGKDDEDEDKDEVKDDDKKPSKEPRIPLARHKEMLERERATRAAVEAKLAQYERGQNIAQTNAALAEAEDKLIALEKRYADEIVDGKVENASKTMAEIRKTERIISETRSDLKSAAAEARAYERARYDSTVERIEAAYPALNPDHDSFDSDLTAEVLDLAEAYQMRNMTPSAALQKAVKVLAGDPQNKRQEEAVERKPRVSSEELAEAKRAERKEEATRRAVATTGKQPPSLNKVGADHDKAGGTLKGADIMKMTQEEFAKLDEKTLSRLRGDVIGEE